MKELKDMNFEELMKWSEDDKSNDESQMVWNEWQHFVRVEAPKHFREMDLCQLNEFYRNHPHEDIPAWYDAWYTSMMGTLPISDIYEKLDAIGTTLDVFLKKHGDEDAGISIRQLVRLKRGHH